MPAVSAGDASPWRVTGGRAVLATALAVMSAGCAAFHGFPPSASRREFRASTVTVMLHGAPLELHLASPSTHVSPTLVVYATGDGGWFGTAVDMFHAIAAEGYRTVGFSSRTFLRIERPPHAALNARQLAADYSAILAAARTALGATGATPALLTGWSRGAAFAAIAASEPALRSQMRGVVAIGLGPNEDLKVDPDDDTDDGPIGTPGARAAGLAPYARLQALTPLRCAVVQASRDEYLPAARARDLFGPDTVNRRLYPVEARNHRFAGGHEAFVAALTHALSWVDTGVTTAQ